MAEEAVLNGGELKLEFCATSIVRNAEGILEISDGKNKILARNIVNSTGANYNKLAKMLGTETYEIEYRRGEYFVLDTSEHALASHVLFPLPSAAGKGILVTPTVDGNILLGPTSETSTDEALVTKSGLDTIESHCSGLVSGINMAKNIRVFSGVRSVVGSDFVVERSKLVDNVVNLAGICSPGLSSAPAISRYVLSELLGLRTNLDPKPLKPLPPYQNFNKLTDSQKNTLIKKDAAFGRIVCRCENISEGEIVAALNRPIRATSTDGIKRRIRAGMGRCQGGFCLDRVITLIAQENNMQMNLVKKEYSGSEHIAGGINEL